MGFFDFLKGSGAAVPPADAPPERLGLIELEERVSKLITPDVRREKAAMKDTHTRLMKHFSRIRDLNRLLETRSFEKQDRIYTAVNMIKDNYTRKSYSLISGLPQVRRFDYEEIRRFHEEAMKAINDLNSIGPRQAVLLSRYFKDETGQIIKTVRMAEEDAKKLGEALGSGSKVWFDKRLHKDVVEIEYLKRRLNETARLQSSAKARKNDLEKQLESRKKALEEFMKSPLYGRATGLESQLRELRGKKEELEQIVLTSLSEIKRPLKKLEHYLKEEEAHSSGEIKLLESILHSPEQAFFSGSGDVVIRGMADRMKQLNDEGKLELDDKERAGVVEFLERFRMGALSGHKGRYEDLIAEAEGLKKEIESSPVFEEKERIEMEVAGFGKGVEDASNEIGDLEKTGESLRNEIAERTNKLEDFVRESTGRKFEIVD